MDEIFCPGAHHKWAFGRNGFSILPEDFKCQFTRFGCHSFMSEQILLISFFIKEIQFGSPPISSNTTIKFPAGFSQDRGTWYLISYLLCQNSTYDSINTNETVLCVLLTISGKHLHSNLSISSH